jgi:hypothetical protein
MWVGGQRHPRAALIPEKRHGTYFTVGWVGPTAGLDGCRKPRLIFPGNKTKYIEKVLLCLRLF